MNPLEENRKPHSEKLPITTVSNISAQPDKSKTAENDFFVRPPGLSLPQGGGAIKGISEKFEVNAVNGTASFSIPLPLANCRNATPSLSLNYNSGGGNSPFGLGWDVSIPSITRKTEKELPRYQDENESDTFIFSGAEDLVPALQQNGSAWEHIPPTPQTEHGITYSLTLYRPRIEGAFTRIEKWKNTNTGELHWRTISKDNILSVYGFTPASRITDPQDQLKVFKWLLSYSCDDKGNFTGYEYKPEDFEGIPSLMFEKNRKNRCSNTYLKRVLYGNKTPFYRGDLFLPESDFMFQLVFDYGEHDPTGTGFYTDINQLIPADVNLPKNTWAYRKDAFSHFRAGFDIRTYRSCSRVMLFHCFEELRIAAAPCLVQSLELVYNDQLQLEQTNDSINGFSFLTRVIRKGHKLNTVTASYSSRALPPFDFTYQQLAWNTTIREITTDSVMHAPSAADGRTWQWIDFYSEGVAGILTEQGNGWYYKSNLGNGHFAAPKLIAPRPSFSGLSGGSMAIQELTGNGKKYAVGYSGSQQGFFGLSANDTWEAYKPFKQLPNIDFKDPDLKWIDLNGDGLPDLLISEEDIFRWYPAKGEHGFDEGIHLLKAKDEELGPVVVFADSTQSVYLADMTGDGLTDIVRIRNGEICYWANMGYGRFSRKVSMENAPTFDHPDNFNPTWLRLADIDGSGTTDIIYFGKNDARIWSNMNGNAWRENPVVIPQIPAVHNAVDIAVMDLLGTGTSCIVWSSPLPADQQHPLRYIHLMDGKKPHLMTGFKNNTGKHVSLQYQSSTHFYLEDKNAGTPWVTKLPFPVHLLTETATTDEISKARFVTGYTYHHGYYDQEEREFRGFGRVDQQDTETYTKFARNNAGNIVDESLHQAPVLTRSWFHTGAFIQEGKILQQFRHEYYQQPGFTEYHVPDAHIVLPTGMLIQDVPTAVYAEALRACKNMLLRKEIYAADGTDLAPYPYSTTEQNCHIRLLQLRGSNKFAVFAPALSETITAQYERVIADPRIKHEFNLDIDEYNNVLSSATVVYPRQVNNPLLPAPLQLEMQSLSTHVKDAQAALHIVLKENSFTNDVITSPNYRLRINAAVQTRELTGCKPGGSFFTLAELQQAATAATPIPWQGTVVANTLQKRLIAHERHLYLADNATTPLPLGQLVSKGLPYEAYKLAYTGPLLNTIYAGKVDATLMTAGQYRQTTALQPLFPGTDDANDWWIPSGTTGYPANPANHFFIPDKYINPFSKISLAATDNKYHLYIPLQQDPMGNQQSVVTYDFRTLQPLALKDPNDNITEVRFDILGMVTGTAQKGKGTEADDFDGFTEDTTESVINNFFSDPATHGAALLQHATSRIVYNLHQLPVSAATILRENHHRDVTVNGLPNKLQYQFEYSGGMDQVLMKKTQTTPGNAHYIDDTGKLQITDTTPKLRWIGNGRTVLNNKGNAVKQYQPYFSVTHAYEDDSRLVEVGPTSILFYDPVSRNIRTEQPDETFSVIAYAGWKQTNSDPNDTVIGSQWYNKRFNRLIDTELIAAGKDPALEQSAAIKAAKHKDTPEVMHLDTLGRTISKIAHNKDQAMLDIFAETAIHLDIKGNTLSVADPLLHTIISWQYDIAGNAVSQQSPETGARITFADVTNQPLHQWDSRSQTIIFDYDDLRRLLSMKVTGGDGATPLNHVVIKHIYGEGQPNDKQNNLRRQPCKVFDQSGMSTRSAYDFNGNPLAVQRQFCSHYDTTIDWGGLPVLLNTEIFESSMTYDALKRIRTTTAPHIQGKPASAYYPAYNETGSLGSMEVSVRGAAKSPYVISINYNEKGMRTDIRYGNNTKTVYSYDVSTLRLLQIRTTRPPGSNGATSGLFKDQAVVQDLFYTYDPAGNITAIKDEALASVFYDGEQADTLNSFEYDALYQLINATGRKHAGQTDVRHTRPDFNYRNQPFINSIAISPNDVNAFRNYQEIYGYDKAGNMTSQQHISKNSGWKRTFEYGNGTNQLTLTTVGGAFSFNYTYDAHGNLKKMEHLSGMRWNFSDALQWLDLGGGGKAWYTYDADGERAHKVILRPDGSIKERFYVGGVEIYREKDNTGKITLERETLQIMDDQQRIAMADSKIINGVSGAPLVRYQYSNHLGSSALELDDAAKAISYEAYFPFGTTSYSTTDASREIPAKRYRYTGKERDEESGLNYHSARYYAPWLCRWTAADPIGIKDGLNIYVYSHNNPTRFIDPTGHDGKDTKPELTPPDSLKPSPEHANDPLYIAGSNLVIAEWRNKMAELQAKIDQLKADFDQTVKDAIAKSPSARKLRDEAAMKDQKDKLQREEKEMVRPESVHFGIDAQIGASVTGLGSKAGPKWSFDALSLTLLPRNLGVQLFLSKDLDIKAFKEIAPQLLIQRQPKDSGRGTETHIVINPVTIDLLNVSTGRWEFAVGGIAGYDATSGNLAFTGTTGAKFTLHKSDTVSLPILGIFGPGKARLYAGVSAEGDVPLRTGAPSGFGGVSIGGGFLYEYDKTKKK
ncbi:RHS repeat-associated protein [Chitinophaga niastensis]|uniref:RHS repeat-associated protein n=1 Tax=Chitinophaga niastensis TaxID=536980 RepID=A0A2P8HGS0_CHINA|nr:SpvB/TcaC N-terminal domain-containing protein [Chitinophaga niastensis]PSL45406.1 RHS repeat-associated protein [Chitinophaga niastensis]